MGRHADARRPRGIARWVITAAVVVLVVAGATVGYLVIVHRANPAVDGRCSTAVSLPVAAGPGAQPAIATAAAAYNRKREVARSACVTATVTAVPDGTALAGLTRQWPASAGKAPGLWIPDSDASLAALDGARPDLAAGHPTDPLAWSPVVLAVRSDDVAAATSLSWSALPTAAGPQGTAALPGGRHLLLDLPPAGSNRATSYAVQSVLAGQQESTGQQVAALGVVEVRNAGPTVRAVGSGSAGDAGTTAEALTALADGTGEATAVPVVEADLVAFDPAGHSLSAIHPDGPTAGDSLIAAPISAAWVDQDLAAAASSFQAFLGTAQAQQILADAGWRTAAAQPAKPVPGVDTGTAVTVLPAGGPAVDAAVAEELGQPVPSSPLPPTGSATAGSNIAGTEGSPSDTGTVATSSPATGATTGTSPTSPTTASSTATTARSVTTLTGPVTPTTPTSSSTPATSTTPNPAATGPVLTLVVDSSAGMSTEVGGRSLLAAVQAAVPTVIGGKITDRVGLWAYSDSVALPPDGYPQLVSTGPLAGKVGTGTRQAALSAAVRALKADGDRWAYGALMAAVDKAADTTVTGRTSRVVLITSGVDETPATPRQMVLTALGAAKGSVRVDVVGLGNAVPADAYNQIATAAGGSYVPVTDPAKLGQVLTDLLTLEP
ncbi:MAG TPA: vWA domain-containing protein [Nakamurella sp.]|nr:vWA domain-containing protein [Nakamurella sp.]